MNKDKALNLALELKNSASAYWTEKEILIIEKLIDSLAQPEQSAEPVELLKKADVFAMAVTHGIDANTKGLYGFYIDCMSTTPPKREWVGLTEEQFLEAARLAEAGNYLVAFQRIQQWLKEKNA